MSNKELNKKFKQLAILEAAKDLFLEKRYSNVTMDEIAERAHITKKTLYSYYPSKLALFIQIFEEYIQQFCLEITTILNSNVPSEELVGKMFQHYYEFTKRNKKFMRLFWTIDSNEFQGVIPEELINRINVWNRAAFEEASKFIEKAQREGVIRECDPKLLIHLISAINKGIFIHTDKENTYQVASIETDMLYNVCFDLLNTGFVKASQRQ